MTRRIFLEHGSPGIELIRIQVIEGDDPVAGGKGGGIP
jgi:hypothetical protein